MNIEEQKDCKILWNYLLLHHELKKSDIILVCGGHDIGVAKEAVRLYKNNYANKIIVSGGITRKFFEKNEIALEADILGDLIISEGVPKTDILFEKEAKNTGENLKFSEKILYEQGLEFKRVIMIQKPYAERRAWYLALKKWPDKDIIMDSEKISFEDYFKLDIPERKIISMMVGEIQRLVYSPVFGWIDQIDIPQEVLNAYKKLCDLGYTERLMSADVIKKCIDGTQNNVSINVS